MRRLLLYNLLLCLSFSSIGQGLSSPDLMEAVSIPRQKLDNYLLKKGFAFAGNTGENNIAARKYLYKGIAKQKNKDSIERWISCVDTKEDFYLTYYTYSTAEYRRILNELKKAGFVCNNERDSLTAASLLYQAKEITVNISSKTVDSLTEHSLLVRRQVLPKPKEILFADDLAVFNSHEYLKYYFGEKNVKKDVYYLSESQVAKCSVLFPNTNRQIVFLWEDEVNNCNLKKMYIGGQLMSESSLDYDKIVAENLWQLKSGIHAGMSLYLLRQLNEASFNFYGGNSANAGMVLTENTGKLNFKSNAVMLGCMNCTDPQFFKKTVINSDDAIQDELILFVHTIIVDIAKE